MEPLRLTPAARRILDAAAELFYTRGIHAVGVDLIAEVAGTTKKTIYDRFGSKDRLVTAYLERREGQWQQYLLDYLDQQPDDPRRRLLAVFDALEQWHLRDPRRGCAFVNANAELTDAAHPARQVLTHDKRWMRDYFAELTRAAGLTEPDSLADQLQLLYDGLLVARSVARFEHAGDAARAAAYTLITTHAR